MLNGILHLKEKLNCRTKTLQHWTRSTYTAYGHVMLSGPSLLNSGFILLKLY